MADLCRADISAQRLPRLALRLAGLRIHSRLRAGSPDKARRAPPPGSVQDDVLAWFLPGGAALTGLRIHSRLQAGSPDKAR